MINFAEDDFSKDYLDKFHQQHSKKTKLLVLLSVIGLTLFVIGSAVLPFKDKILDTFYPKKQSQATEIKLAPNVPDISYGFTGWDIGGISTTTFSTLLGTQLTNGYGFAKNPANIYMIGKTSQLQPLSDPSNLKLLTDTNLDNISFAKAGPIDAYGYPTPLNWTISSSGNGGAVLEDDPKTTTNAGTPSGNPEGESTVVMVYHISGTNGTQIAQKSKRAVVAGQWIIFGVWVKSSNTPGIPFVSAPDLPNVSIFLQNPANSQPFPNSVITSYTKENDIIDNDGQNTIGTSNILANVLARPGAADAPGKIYRWTFVTGYVQVPVGVSNFQLVLKVTEGSAWFDGAVAAIIDYSSAIDSGTVDNNQIKAIVEARPGSAWIIGNEPGAEEDCYVGKTGTSYDASFIKNIKHTPPEYDALIYHQFYKLIKKYDPNAIVMPGGLAGNSAPWDRENGGPWRTNCSNAKYNPKQYLDKFRTAYKTQFKLSGENVEPPVDGIAIHYYENEKTPDALNANKFKAYMQNLRTYMDGVAGWQGKLIWLNEFGTRRDELTDTSGVDHSVEFAQNALEFLKTNSLNIQKWFWFETCGNAGVSPLFEMQSPGVCKKDAFGSPILTKLGQIWANQDKGSIRINTSIQIQNKIQIY